MLWFRNTLPGSEASITTVILVKFCVLRLKVPITVLKPALVVLNHSVLMFIDTSSLTDGNNSNIQSVGPTLSSKTLRGLIPIFVYLTFLICFSQ